MKLITQLRFLLSRTSFPFPFAGQTKKGEAALTQVAFVVIFVLMRLRDYDMPGEKHRNTLLVGLVKVLLQAGLFVLCQASKLIAMASNLLAMASNILYWLLLCFLFFMYFGQTL